MKFNFKRWLICLIVATLFITAFSACAGGSGGTVTNTQEARVDEGDIIKIAEDGTIFSLQSDGLTIIRTEQGEPYVLDFYQNTTPRIPLEMYLKDNVLITLTGELDDYYAGDYNAYRSAEHNAVTVTVYDISYLARSIRHEQPPENLKHNVIYSFESYSQFVESRLTEDGSLYLFTKYEDVYSPSFDSDGALKGFSRLERSKFTVDTTVRIDVSNVRYNERKSNNYIEKALYVEPTNTTYKTETVTALFRIDSITQNPRLGAKNAVYGSDLSTVYMSENNVYPVFSATSRPQGCGRAKDNLILTRFDKDLSLRAKKFLYSTTAPSRYAFKELDGVLFATVQTGGSVYLGSYNDKLEQLSSVFLCYNEDLKAVNYTEDEQGKAYAYAVTFRQTDPLYKVDITDPYNLTVESELEITGFSVYLHKFPPYYTVGIGYEATTSGQITGAKVTLFDTSELQSTEINSLVIPGVDYAEILDDPRALYVHPSEIVFGFSLRRSYKVADTNVSVYKQGYYLFGVKDGRLVDIAYLSNFDGGIVGGEQAFYDYSTYRKTIRRATVIGDHLLTVADGMIVSYPVLSLANGDKTPAYTLITDIRAILLEDVEDTPAEREDGIFFEG